MMRRAIVILALFAQLSLAQTPPWTGILDPSRAIDWSKAGIPGGIPTITTQCGSTLAPSGGDDTAALQAALNACAAGTFFQLASGTFHTAGAVTMPNQVVLRGMGADQTILQMNSSATANTSSFALVLGSGPGVSAGQPQYSHTMPITSSNSKGDTTVTLGTDVSGGSISQLHAGYMVWIAPMNDWFPTCAGYPNTVPATSTCINTASDVENATPGGGSGFNMDGAFGAVPSARAAGQMDLITNVNTATNTITLEDPLIDSFRHPLQDWVANSPANPITGFNYAMVIRPSSQTAPVPHVYLQSKPSYSPAPGYCLTGPTPPVWPTDGSSTVTETVPGIASPNVPCAWTDLGPGTDSSPRLMYFVPNQNVGIENLQIFGVNNFQFGNFVSLVSINNCLHCWMRGVEINRPIGFIIKTTYSYHGQFEQNFVTTSWYHGSGTDSVLEIDAGTSGFLIQNNIFERTPEAAFTDNGGSGNVIAYNYALGNWGANAVNAATATLLSHDAFPWFNLQEGNIVSQMSEDGIHGGNALGTKFRNWATVTTKICQPISPTGLTAGVQTRPPAPPTVTTNSPGSTTYSYAVEIVVGGAQSAPSLNTTITNGPATLSGTTFNTITAPNVPNANVITSTTPPPNAPTDRCLIFRTAGGTAAQISPAGIGIPCDGVSTVQDTGQASTGVAIGSNGAGNAIVPNTTTICTPQANNETTAGANAWFAYQALWPHQYGQYSARFNDVGNVTGSQDEMTVSAQSNVNLPVRRKACAICNSFCANNGVTCGGGGTTCSVVTCGTARSYAWILEESLGFGSGAGGIGTNDTSLPQDTAFHCKNYFHSVGAVETGDCSSSTVLPPSFYLSAKPTWWGSAHWPPIGPDITGGLPQSFGYAYNNPAKNCYENVMSGTDSTGAPFLHFNAAACYSAVATSNLIQGVGKIQGVGVIKQ